MKEIIELIIKRNTERKILNREDIKRICNIIIKCKRYELLVLNIFFLPRNKDDETIAAYNGVDLLFYTSGLENLKDTVEERNDLDGTKIDIINYQILSTIFHEFAHVRQLVMIDNYSGNEAKIYRICNELRENIDFVNENYNNMLDEVNAYGLGEINANKVYQSLPSAIITKNDKNVYNGYVIDTLLSNYIVNLDKELIISPSEQLLLSTKAYDFSKTKYDYERFKNIIIACKNNDLYHRLLVGLPISFSEYAYTNMFMTNFDPNSRYNFIKKLQKHR